MKRKFSKQKKIKIIFYAIVFVLGTLFLAKAVSFMGNKTADYFYNHVCLCSSENFNESTKEYFLPMKNWNVDHYSSNSQSAYAVYVENGKNPKVLFAENYEKKLPIASITKLMTALIVLENYNLENKITITEEAFQRDAFRPDNLNIGEQYIIGDLLYPLLLESSNTTAYALAEKENLSSFISQMNQRAKEIGMNSTSFFNSSGLDPDSFEYRGTNTSTGKDIAVLLNFLLENKPELWKILSLPSYSLKTANGVFKKRIVNTNELLEQIPGIVGGKTGRTIRAGDCLALVTKKSKGHIITVILGTQYRFEETKRLLEWINKAYYWEI